MRPRLYLYIYWPKCRHVKRAANAGTNTRKAFVNGSKEKKMKGWMISVVVYGDVCCVESNVAKRPRRKLPVEKKKNPDNECCFRSNVHTAG